MSQLSNSTIKNKLLKIFKLKVSNHTPTNGRFRKKEMYLSSLDITYYRAEKKLSTLIQVAQVVSRFKVIIK